VLSNETTVGAVAPPLAHAYWGKGMYPEVVKEFKRYGELAGDQNDSEFGAAPGTGFSFRRLVHD
jgi:hypothetical protein